MFGGDSINHFSLSDPHSDDDNTKHSRGHFSLTRLLTRRRKSSDNAFGHLEDRFIRIALRVSLYPLAMIVVNTLIAAGDLYISINGVTTTPGYALYCVYYWFYGGRGIVFCCLALFVDPCLSKGVYAAWRIKFPSKHDGGNSPRKDTWNSDTAGGHIFTGDDVPVATAIDSLGGDGPAAPQNSLQRADSAGSMDMLQALFASEPPHLAEERRQQEARALRDAARAARRQSRRTSVASMFWRRGSRDVETPPLPAAPAPSLPPAPSATPPESPQESPGTMTFAGVEDGFLPAEFEDLTDVVSPEGLAQAAAERERQEREERDAAAAAEAKAAAQREKELASLDRISEHSSGASTPNLVTTLAYMARGRRASRGPGGHGHGGAGASASASTSPSGARSPNMGHGSPVPRGSSYAHSHSARPSSAGAWGSEYGPSRASGDVAPADPRARRRRALEIAEKLYEEMEQQL